ncbi:MAG: tRNA (adenosine(37)-N6)-threonylcarbamoyltransferase complex dimerization subunit type 1 TsaB [Proteocatella sp.]
MKILSIDSSSAALGIAMSDENTMLAEFTQNKALTHSEKLMPLVEIMMNNIEEDIDTVDAMACTIGPGSFTGIRIGVATANAFAMAKNIPIIGISSLEGLSYNFRHSAFSIVSTMYAQRDDYYRGIYRYNDAELEILETEDAISFDEILDEIKEMIESGQKVMLVGEMVDKMKLRISEENTKNPEKQQRIDFSIKMMREHKLKFADKNLNYLRASNLCEIAMKILGSGKTENLPRYVEPVYIRKPQAEVQYEEKMMKQAKNKIEAGKNGK